jgi:hypothetical protein
VTRKPEPLPDVTAIFILPDGRPSPDFYRWLRDADQAVKATIDFIDTPVADPVHVLIEEWSVFIAFPANKDYILALDGAVDREVYEVVTKCASGTCTVTIKTDSTALGGTANSASSTQQIQAHTTSNTWNVDEDLVATISANSSCVDLTVTVKTRRTIVSA